MTKAAVGLVTLLLAGCFGGPNSQSPGSAPRGWEQFESCPDAYPDNSTGACTHLLGELAVLGRLPGAPWVCTKTLSGGYAIWRFYTNPTNGRVGFAFEQRWGVAVGGVAHGPSEMRQFKAVGATGFVEWPQDWGDTMSVQLHLAKIQTNNTKLESAPISLLWSKYEAEPWGVFQMKPNDEPHKYFEGMRPDPLGKGWILADAKVDRDGMYLWVDNAITNFEGLRALGSPCP